MYSIAKQVDVKIKKRLNKENVITTNIDFFPADDSSFSRNSTTLLTASALGPNFLSFE